jgi:hypothetical protein
MGLDISKMLTPSRAPFYGIFPGNAATPLGSVVLPVTFGTKDNYRIEYIKFEVADFESSYHAMLDRLVSGHQELATLDKCVSEEITKNGLLERKLEMLEHERTRETWLLKNDL